jgi:hypothetical protein
VAARSRATGNKNHPDRPPIRRRSRRRRRSTEPRPIRWKSHRRDDLDRWRVIGKRLQLLKELAPAVTRVACIASSEVWESYRRTTAATDIVPVFAPVGYQLASPALMIPCLVAGALINPNFPAAVNQLQQIKEAARTVGQRIVVGNASTDAELDAAFASFVREGTGALLVAGDPFFDTRRERIVALAAQQRLPAAAGCTSGPAGGIAAARSNSSRLSWGIGRGVLSAASLNLW